MSRVNEKNLSEFIRLQVQENRAWALLCGIADWLRQSKGKYAAERLAVLTDVLLENGELCAQAGILLNRWLRKVRLYPLLISAGIFAREGFRREMTARLYEKINPSYKDGSDLRDVFSQLFYRENDRHWLESVPAALWLKLFSLLSRHTPEGDRKTLHDYLRQEGLHAVEMLSIWVAAEALEPDLIRLDPKLLDRDSPFVALKREVSYWLRAKASSDEFDDSHLYVMLDQCRKQVETLRKKGTGAGAGSSLGVAHLLERLDQTFDRMVLLLDVFAPEVIPPRDMLKLTGTLASAAAEQHGVAPLWKRSVRMLSRSITQNTGDHGEHYITRNKKEYLGMFYSAAAGGVLIALMSLLKIHFGKTIDNYFLYSLVSGLNYGIGFALIFMLGGTVATKQPAMTASHFAAAAEGNDKGVAVDMKLAQLLVDVLRSQMAAVAGNVLTATATAMVIAALWMAFRDFPILNKAQVNAQLAAVDPWKPTLLYAAIAGVWLFCSGIISGFFDNRCDYLNLRMRLRHHPVLKRLLPEKLRARFADYMHDNYGSLMGNLCFGMLLAMTGFIGHATGLPLDIRHIAFSSANVGYAAVSGSIGFWLFVQSMLFVLLIGVVNLAVSFAITLWVALRSRGTHIQSGWNIFLCVLQIARERPLSLFLPHNLPPEPVPPAPRKGNKETVEAKDHTGHHAA